MKRAMAESECIEFVKLSALAVVVLNRPGFFRG